MAAMDAESFTQEEAQANVNLIAAAPELLEALEDALDYIDNLDTEPMYDNDKRNRAEAIISKARGED